MVIEPVVIGTLNTYLFLFIVSCFGILFTMLIMWLVVGCFNVYNINKNLERWIKEEEEDETRKRKKGSFTTGFEKDWNEYYK